MNRLFTAFSFALLCSLPAVGQRLAGATFPEWQYADSVFSDPFVDTDEWRSIIDGTKVRYVHGGFADGTRFCFFFPEEGKFEGRFFQMFHPFPVAETTSLMYLTAPLEQSHVAFAVKNGGYYVETNEGGVLDVTTQQGSREPSISAYRANAACAMFSRVVAGRIFSAHSSHIYGYCFGGSGGAYRTTGSIENTEGVWDGAVPFVLGSPHAIPNVFAVRMNALRVLHDKLPQIADCMDAGGSGDPTPFLNEEERECWRETCAMGFPARSWYGYRYMDIHGFVMTYSAIRMMLPQYFDHDYWQTPGYFGHDNPQSANRDRVQIEAVVRGFMGQKECEELNLVPVVDESDTGDADKASRNAGTEEEKPRALRLNIQMPVVHFMGGDLIIKSGKGQGLTLQLHGIANIGDTGVCTLATVCPASVIALLQEGDTVMIDNSAFIAAQTLHRHQAPGREYYAWDYFRNADGTEKYPQQPMLVGPLFTQLAAGCLPTGDIKAKVILVGSLWDREAYPWQVDCYRRMVISKKGEAFCRDNFRVWYTDRATHGEVDDASQVVSYGGVILQALLDLSAWVERGVLPPASTRYSISGGQVLIPDEAADRGGVQPSVSMTVCGKQCKRTSAGRTVKIRVTAVCPKGTGRIVRAELAEGVACDFSEPAPLGNAVGKPAEVEYREIDLSKARYSRDGERVEFDVCVKYTAEGTYFPAVRVTAQRSGEDTPFTKIQNLNRIRIIVK